MTTIESLGVLIRNSVEVKITMPDELELIIYPHKAFWFTPIYKDFPSELMCEWIGEGAVSSAVEAYLNYKKTLTGTKQGDKVGE